jgi:fluoroquinolone transport system permease protein
VRRIALLSGDIRFQFKYGFYFIYIVFSILYIGLLFALPPAWRMTAGILMIFTDPAAMGLYFMGAIVLFEKSERVLDSISISPVKPLEYVLSKLISLAVISTVVAAVIGFSGGIISDTAGFIMAVFFGSSLFSSVGLIVAANISTLNEFIIATIPAELVINIPAAAYIFGYKRSWLLFHPGVSIIELCSKGQHKLVSILVLLVWTAFFTILANGAVRKMFKSVGGVRL